MIKKLNPENENNYHDYEDKMNEVIDFLADRFPDERGDKEPANIIGCKCSKCWYIRELQEIECPLCFPNPAKLSPIERAIKEIESHKVGHSDAFISGLDTAIEILTRINIKQEGK